MEGLLTIVIIMCVLHMAVIGLVIFNGGIDESWREQIVKHGCAEFYLDDKNERQWRWKE